MCDSPLVIYWETVSSISILSAIQCVEKQSNAYLLSSENLQILYKLTVFLQTY